MRPDYCPIGGEPCQSLCDVPCGKGQKATEQKAHGEQHPYVRKMIGCSHGVLFTDYCQECEIVGLIDEYKRAVRTVQRVRDRMRVLGQPMPGSTP